MSPLQEEGNMKMVTFALMMLIMMDFFSGDVKLMVDVVITVIEGMELRLILIIWNIFHFSHVQVTGFSYFDKQLIVNNLHFSYGAGRSGNRIPEGGEIFRTRPDHSLGHPNSCILDTGSLPGVKRSGYGVDHPPPSTAEVKEIVMLHLYSPSGPSWSVVVWILTF